MKAIIAGSVIALIGCVLVVSGADRGGGVALIALGAVFLFAGASS